MGSPAELEVHAHFHNYHGKLKFVGSQLLKSRPNLPSCNQGLHSNNLVPEGSDGYVCQWENCDVGIFYLWKMHKNRNVYWMAPHHHHCCFRIYIFVFIQSTFNNPEWFYRHVDNHVESAEQQCLSDQQQALFCLWTGIIEEEEAKEMLLILTSCSPHLTLTSAFVLVFLPQAAMPSSRSDIV